MQFVHNVSSLEEAQAGEASLFNSGLYNIRDVWQVREEAAGSPAHWPSINTSVHLLLPHFCSDLPCCAVPCQFVSDKGTTQVTSWPGGPKCVEPVRGTDGTQVGGDGGGGFCTSSQLGSLASWCPSCPLQLDTAQTCVLHNG
jgi:hypothetical protein